MVSKYNPRHSPDKPGVYPSGQELIEYANRAFTLGLVEGRARNRTERSGQNLIATLGYTMPITSMHRAKIRQVYMAGFAIARLHNAIDVHGYADLLTKPKKPGGAS